MSASTCSTAKERRIRPLELGDPGGLDSPLTTRGEASWLEPVPDGQVVPSDGDPAQVAEERETLKLAFVAALQHLPPQQRAVLILREALRWRANEVAELLETSVASVNSSLQRARASLDATEITPGELLDPLDAEQQALLERYVAAFEAYDMDAITSLLHEDAKQSMPPYEMWLLGREDILRWWTGPGIGCKGSRLIPTVANGLPAFGQYRPSGPGGSFEPWALQVLELSDGRNRRLHRVSRHRAALPALRPPARRRPNSTPASPTRAISSCRSGGALTRRRRSPCRLAWSEARASAFTTPRSAERTSPRSHSMCYRLLGPS
jgi:RNA polymerase sigma-70 factor (ECF subfamily)